MRGNKQGQAEGSAPKLRVHPHRGSLRSSRLVARRLGVGFLTRYRVGGPRVDALEVRTLLVLAPGRCGEGGRSLKGPDYPDGTSYVLGWV